MWLYTLNKIIVFLINITGVWLIYLMTKKGPNKKIAELFTLMTLLMFTWVDFAYLARVLANELGLWMIKGAWSITPLFFITIYFFVDIFFKEKERYSGLKLFLVILGILNMPIVLFSPFIIKNIWLNNQGVLEIIYGGWEWVFFGEVFVLTILNFFMLFKKRNTVSSDQRKKVDYLIMGFSFFFIMNSIFNISFPVFFNIFNLYVFGDYSTIILLSFIVYAVIKNELFGIKTLLSQSLIIIISILLLSNIFISGSLSEYIWNGVLFVSFGLFGLYFIKSMRARMESRKKIESYSRRLKGANNQLKKLDKQKTEFMSFAAHQLRSPLTSVRGFASLIQEGAFGKTPKKIKGAAEKIYEASGAMSDSVDDYLNISRIEQGRMEYNLKELDLYELAKGVVEEQQPTANEKKLKLTIISDKYKKYPTKVDHSKVRQVINNFVDNAVKYTPKGKVEVRVSRKKGRVLIAIKDSGIGMKKETIKKLFRRYSRAEDTQGISGTGLGLYIAHKMIEAQKGQVWAESKGENKGSTFFIQLPLLKK
ncbi:hypothetical protein K8R62_03450 [bacterium]|nr:hypothetical protein [bacterium]